MFEGMGDGVPERGVSCLPVKQAGLDVLDPTMTASENWTASCVITGHLVAALRVQVEFRMVDHSAASGRDGRRFGEKASGERRRQ